MTIELSCDAVIAYSDLELNPHQVAASPCCSRQCMIFQVLVDQIVADPSFEEVIRYKLLALNEAQITGFMAFLRVLILSPFTF